MEYTVLSSLMVELHEEVGQMQNAKVRHLSASSENLFKKICGEFGFSSNANSFFHQNLRPNFLWIIKIKWI